MADCAPLLDEELSSFVFNYLTENSCSQVRVWGLRTHGTSGFAEWGASLRVARRGASKYRLDASHSPRLVSSISPGSVRSALSLFTSVRVYYVLTCGSFTCVWRNCQRSQWVDVMWIKSRRFRRWWQRWAAGVCTLLADSLVCRVALVETFDAILREVFITVPETWTRGAPLSAWTYSIEDYCLNKQ